MSRVNSIGLPKIQNNVVFKGNSSMSLFLPMMKQKPDSVHFGMTVDNAAGDQGKEPDTQLDPVKAYSKYRKSSRKLILARKFIENIDKPSEIDKILIQATNNNMKDFILEKVKNTNGDKVSILDYTIEIDRSISQSAGEKLLVYLNKLAKDTDSHELFEKFFDISHEFAKRDYLKEGRPVQQKKLALNIMELASEFPNKFLQWDDLSDDIKGTSKYIEIIDKIAVNHNLDKKLRTEYINKNLDCAEEYKQDLLDVIEAGAIRKEPEELSSTISERLPVPLQERVPGEDRGLYPYLDKKSTEENL